MKIRFLILFFLLMFFPCISQTVVGQKFQSIKQAEDTLAAVIDSLNHTGNDSVKQLINQAFAGNLYTALTLSAADNYPFSSLKTLVKISSPDQKFRIFHWNLPANNGRHRYYGFIKILNTEPPLIFKLTDVSDSIDSPDTASLEHQQWYGALYYKVIPGETASGGKFYTLLGWAGKNPLVTQKVIEILWFDDHDNPHFGLKLFPDFHDGTMTRIIFRFAATTTMSLKYEMRAMPASKTWNSKKKIFEYTMAELPVIVCDRLGPLDPRLKGNYQFYVADGDTFDAFVFKNHLWRFSEGMEAKNRK